MSAKERRFLAMLATVALASAVFTCGEGIREDVLSCEEAVARLAKCCPGFDAGKVYCRYSGCGSEVWYPALDLDESHCVRDSSCEMLRTNDVCGRAQRAHAHVNQPSGGEVVCP